MLGIDLVCIVLGLAGMLLAYTMDPKRNMWEGPWQTPAKKNRYSDLVVGLGADKVKLGEMRGARRGAMIVAGQDKCVRAVMEQVGLVCDSVLVRV